MKGFLVLLLVTIVAAAHAGQQCPTEQWVNWEIELLLPHEDCDKFYKCTYGEPVAQDCPGGLAYNIETQQCDWKQKVDCGDRNIPAPPNPEESDEESESAQVVGSPEEEDQTEITPVSEESTENEADSSQETENEADSSQETENEADLSQETEKIEFQENGCPVNTSIYWSLPSDEDCTIFYVCVRDEKVEKHCPSGLHFNTELQVCDWPADAGCAVSFNKHASNRRMLVQRTL